MEADPFLLCFKDHEAIRTRLRALERALDVSMNRNRAEGREIAVFSETGDFLRTSAMEHMRNEEESILPPLEARVGRFGTLVNVIVYDHEEIRREVGKFTEALAALEARGEEPHVAELRELNRHGIFLVQYLRLHMAKEESSFAEMARQALGEHGLAEVARRLEGLR